VVRRSAEEVTYVTVSMFNGLAKRVLSKLTKGSFVAVAGRLELNVWEQDGEKRQQLRVVALEVTSPDFFKKADEPQPLPFEEAA
jgi:single-stranded DNA-binding protein